MQALLDLILCVDIMDESYDKIKGLSREGFLIFVGNLIDQYGADHGLNSEQTCEMLTRLSEVQKITHSEIGPARPSA